MQQNNCGKKSSLPFQESLNQRRDRAIAIIEILQKATSHMQQPASTLIVNRYGKDPYLILVACVLSLRAKDSASEPAARRLFDYAKTPEQMIALKPSLIEKLIYSVGFYRQKTRQIIALSHQLLDHFSGKVPANEANLLSLTGVGRKTANLVLGEAFDIPALCVDTHVHRISNRLGLVTTKTPEQTEQALKELLPERYWIMYNKLLVMWGQNICVPIAPLCSICPIAPLCPRKGVTRSR